MNNRTWLLLSLLLPHLAVAQQDSSSVPNLVTDHRITVTAAGSFDSNVLYNDLVMGLYRGGRLDRDVRQRSMEALGSGNRAGYQLRGTATYAWGDSLLGHPRWMPRVSLAYTSVMGMHFSKEAYALSFFGNKAFEDRSAAIGPGGFEQVSYQALSFGIEDRQTGSFLELAVVNGHSLNAGNINKADLYTAPAGRYLELQLDGRYQRSDTASTGINRGIGAAINAQWRRPIKLFGSRATLALALTDLGFVTWNDNALSMDKDSTIRYEGIAVSDILDLDGLLVNETTLQDSLGLGFEKGGFTRLLPVKAGALLCFGKLRSPHADQRRQAYELEVDYRYLPGYVPHASITRNLSMGKHFLAMVGAGYGGFGGFRGAVGFAWSCNELLRIVANTPNAVGFFSGQTRGKALSVGLEAAW